jgi:RHS repeat-associated protein
LRGWSQWHDGDGLSGVLVARLPPAGGRVGAFDAAYQNLEPSADFSGDAVVDSTDLVMFTEALIAEFFGAPPDEVRIGYAGYVRDPLMEILLARHRWYDSRAGRWLTRDPAGYVDGLSLYLFVKGNPLGLVDPAGLQSRWGGDVYETVRRYLSERTPPPEFLAIFCRAFRVSADWLLLGDSERQDLSTLSVRQELVLGAVEMDLQQADAMVKRARAGLRRTRAM